MCGAHTATGPPAMHRRRPSPPAAVTGPPRPLHRPAGGASSRACRGSLPAQSPGPSAAQKAHGEGSGWRQAAAAATVPHLALGLSAERKLGGRLAVGDLVVAEPVVDLGPLPAGGGSPAPLSCPSTRARTSATRPGRSACTSSMSAAPGPAVRERHCLARPATAAAGQARSPCRRGASGSSTSMAITFQSISPSSIMPSTPRTLTCAAPHT